MFWRSKTATSQQATQSVLGDAEARPHENFVREPANQDTSRGWAADLGERPASSWQSPVERAYVVPASYRVSGNLILSRAVVVQGEVNGGSIDAPIVTVPRGGRLAAPTKGATVIINGIVEGDVSASVELCVGPDAEIRGSLNAPAVRVESGAKVSEATLFVGPKR
jgi:cytoskeletal protein CcmA (bactofilin family)